MVKSVARVTRVDGGTVPLVREPKLPYCKTRAHLCKADTVPVIGFSKTYSVLPLMAISRGANAADGNPVNEVPIACEAVGITEKDESGFINLYTWTQL